MRPLQVDHRSEVKKCGKLKRKGFYRFSILVTFARMESQRMEELFDLPFSIC